jgi:nucleoside permease NupC
MILKYSPLFWLKGVALEDCQTISKLIGIKMFVNEFVAYSELGKTINFRNNATSLGTLELYRNGTLSIPDGLFMIWNVYMIKL